MEPSQHATQQAGSADGKESAGSDQAAAGEQPLPLPYVLGADGSKQPLPGSKSIFVRGGTAEAFGLAALTCKPGGQLMATVPKDKLLSDIQFQGAISDFHPIKDAIKAADYDPLLVRANEDDIFGDGNNYEVAVTLTAAEAWQAADAAVEAAKAAAQAAADAAESGGGMDAGQPRSKRRRDPQPWQDLGTEAELVAAGICSINSTSTASAAASSSSTKSSTHLRPGGSSGDRGMPTGLLLNRPRRAFGAATTLVDAPASDLWASNTMEVRPFKDAAYDLRRMTLDAAAQAVPHLLDAAVQATGGRPRNCCCQTAPQSLPPEELEGLMASPAFAAFLDAARPRLDEALLQNSIADILAVDLDQLGDEEGEGLAGTGSKDDAAAAGASGPSGSGHRQERGGLTEAQSFTDLAYSKNKVVSYICWVPNRRGVVAAACTDPASQSQRLLTMGRLTPSHILIWNFRDPIHPEYVLESPHEVTTFQYNPVNPDIIVGGCYNGQVIVWDTSGYAAANRGSKGSSMSSGGGSNGGSKSHSSRSSAIWQDDAESDAAAVTPIIRHKYLSSVEHSHASTICDLCWLPGIEIDRTGRAFPIRANSAGTSAQSLLRSMTLGAAAVAAAAAGSNIPREACFFASIAPDGKVMFWDVRLEKLMKKGNKRVDETEVVWKPMHVVHLLSVAGNDFAGHRFCFDPYRLDSGNFSAASMDGELLAGNFIKPPGDDNPDYTHVVFSPHAGPVVALTVNPFIPELLMSVGDWTFRLWHEGLDSKVPVFVSPHANEAYTAAAWSPSRPGLLFLATAAGSLQVWDLLDRSHEPALTITASSCAITSIAFSSSPPKHATHGGLIPASESAAAAGVSSGSSHGGTGNDTGGQPLQLQPLQQQQHQASSTGLQVLAVGDAAGVLRLFELPRTLRRPLQNERRLMEAFVAREAARCDDVASRQALRAAALADAKKVEESKKPVEDSSNITDQQQAPSDAAARQSVISNQAGTLAGVPAPVTAATKAGAAAAAAAADIAKAEAAYKQLEEEFRAQLGLSD